MTGVQAVHGKSSTAAKGLSKAPPPDTVLADLVLGVCEGMAGYSAQAQFLSLLLLLCRLTHSIPLVSKREMGLVEKKEVLQVVTVLQLGPCVLSPATWEGAREGRWLLEN